MVEVRVRLLGPVGVEVDGRAVKLGSQLRLMLAVLALARGRPVARERLTDLMWGRPAPAAAAATLRSHLAHLRRVLEPARPSGRAPQVLVTEDHGYALRLPADRLDFVRFERLLADGRRALRDSDAATAADRLAAALRLWSGPALAGVADRSFAVAEATRLDALRTTARRLRVEAEIALGRSEEVLAELSELVDAEPADERLRARLALALYRCQRLDAAIQLCADGLRLAHERGLDAPALQQIQTDILRRAPSLDWVPHGRSARPFQLPPDIPEFTGRAAELAAVCDRLTGGWRTGGWLTGDRQAAPAMPVVAIDGKPGIGKSALAVHAGHRLAGAFPDGALYVNLRGVQPHRLEPGEVLGALLQALGVADPPAQVDAASAALRSALTGRRVLVLLDNAADAAQVRPLLPAAAGSAVLVTSRRPLVDLDGASTMSLDLLTTDEAVSLLGRLAGRGRVDAEPAPARAVVQYCGLLPLAVRIAGARLRARPGWSVAAFAERLADQRRRLGELAAGDLAVRSSFRLSYQALDGADRRLFRLLGLLDGPDFGVEAAAALADRQVLETEHALERLVDAQLLETHRAGRYRFHDLLRLFAGDCTRTSDDETTRQLAVARALRWYARCADQAGQWVLQAARQPPNPRFACEQDALAWLDAERANLVAAAEQAAAAAPAPIASVAWELDRALVRYLHIRKYWSDWTAICQAAASAAARAGEPGAEGAAHRHLGMIRIQQRRFGDALDHLRYCVALLRQAGDGDEEAKTLCDLGILHGQLADWEQAAGHFRQAIEAARQIGNVRLEAHAINNLGLVLSEQGRFAEAVHHVNQTLRILSGMGEDLELSNTLDSLGTIYHKQGDYARAIDCYQRGLRTARRYGDRYNEANALRGLGVATAALRGEPAARRYLEQALEIFVSIEAPEAKDVERLLSSTVG
ncbi:MAG TPA: tetratricopeptide repeat protein [Pseudonocardiaceae bacterium]|nr:tetratricopeptide repeat protein [Pseudonocardiaceae bacterium]